MAAKKKYCPKCGSDEKTFKFDGGFFEELPTRYGCETCKILFSIEKPDEDFVWG